MYGSGDGSPWTSVLQRGETCDFAIPCGSFSVSEVVSVSCVPLPALTLSTGPLTEAPPLSPDWAAALMCIPHLHLEAESPATGLIHGVLRPPGCCEFLPCGLWLGFELGRQDRQVCRLWRSRSHSEHGGSPLLRILPCHSERLVLGWTQVHLFIVQKGGGSCEGWISGEMLNLHKEPIVFTSSLPASISGAH